LDFGIVGQEYFTENRNLKYLVYVNNKNEHLAVEEDMLPICWFEEIEIEKMRNIGMLFDELAFGKFASVHFVDNMCLIYIELIIWQLRNRIQISYFYLT
jgi:hypothetical protein